LAPEKPKLGPEPPKPVPISEPSNSAPKPPKVLPTQEPPNSTPQSPAYGLVPEKPKLGLEPQEPKPIPESPNHSPGKGLKKPGIVYSPYNDDHKCKTKDEMHRDIEMLKGYNPIRLYGIDCDQIEIVIDASKRFGMQVFIGIYDIEKYKNELDDLIKAVGGRWGTVQTVSIGNEVVNFGKKPAGDYAVIIKTSRSILRVAGYQGPVVGVDTFVAIMNNPAICEASDYVAANCHPFFDGKITAEKAGEFIDQMKIEIRKSCGNKRIVITGKPL
jgi:exo-beta-1,3-glucanase (GH17 family)